MSAAMAPDRSAAGLNRDNGEQPADVGAASPTGSGALQRKKEFLAKFIPAGDHLLTWPRLLVTALAAMILAALWVFVIPWIQLALNTVSTDDAFVNGHVARKRPSFQGLSR
jgi:membrane fusion protein (multidrug efflux system)